MKKIIAGCLFLISALVLTGCGNPHKDIVAEICAAVRDDNRERSDELAKKFIDFKSVEKGVSRERDRVWKHFFEAIAKGKKQEKISVVKTFKKDGDKVTIIKATIDEGRVPTLFFAVKGNGKEKSKIVSMASDESGLSY